MSTRIPASLNWLVNKRARLNGKILRTQKALEEAQRLGIDLSEELSKLHADLQVIDRALQMHEIQVDPNNIRPISSQLPRVAVPYGELTRTLFIHLRANAGKPISTDVLAEVVLEKFPSLREKVQDFVELRLLRVAVGKRLKKMAADKVITRLPPLPGSAFAQWLFS